MSGKRWPPPPDPSRTLRVADLPAMLPRSSSVEHTGPWVDALVVKLITQVSVHDDPAPGCWACGECPYMNVGPICTKCGAPRWKGKGT